MEPVESVLKNIYQSSTYRKELSRPYFDDEPRVQKKQEEKDQQPCIFVFVDCLTILSSNKGHQPRHDHNIHTWTYSRVKEIQSNLRRKKLHRAN